MTPNWSCPCSGRLGRKDHVYDTDCCEPISLHNALPPSSVDSRTKGLDDRCVDDRCCRSPAADIATQWRSVFTWLWDSPGKWLGSADERSPTARASLLCAKPNSD